MTLKDFIEKINKKTCVLQAIKVENPETLIVTKRETIESLGTPTEGCSEDQRKLKAQSEDAFENDKQMKSSNSNAKDEFTEIFNSAVSKISRNYSDGSIEFIEKIILINGENASTSKIVSTDYGMKVLTLIPLRKL